MATRSPFSRTHPAPPAPGGPVLIVDDNDAIRETVDTILTLQGYRTLAFADATKALAAYSEHPSDFALVITDLDMPRLDGRALAKAIRRINPIAKILFMSGTSSDERLRNVANLPGADFLAKPFRMEALLTTVRRLLEKPSLAA